MGGGVLEKKKTVQQEGIKEIDQQTKKKKKIKSLFTKLAEKCGYMGETCLFLCLRGKKVCFWLRAKKVVAEGKKPERPHLSCSPPLINYGDFTGVF